MAIGVSMSSEPPKTDGEKPNIDNTLYFVFPGEGKMAELEVKLPVSTDRKDFLRVVRDTFSGLVNNIVPQNVIGAKRVQPDIRHAIRGGFDDGVVAIRAMTNKLVGAVYTTGEFKVWSISNGTCLALYDLLGSLNEEESKT